mmetsp:Transcript_5677/g.12375  ORF Transcript_5677/g.12375 Transcript_5677/m.12375 type:complete len:509 (-) Transcript_5677:213-1739(-)
MSPELVATATANDEEAAIIDQQSTNDNTPSHHAAPVVTSAIALDLSATDDNDVRDLHDVDVDDLQNISPTAIANAEHLDHLEASGSIHDIASFQDIELPKNNNGNIPHSPASTATTTRLPGDGSSPPSDSDGIRRAKRYYYCLPMITRYRYPIVGCFSAFVLLIVAISLSASTLQRANEIASHKMDEGSNNGHEDQTIILDAPPSDYNDQTSGGYQEDWYGAGWDGDSDNNDGEGHEEIGDIMEAIMVSDAPTDSPGGKPKWPHVDSITWPSNIGDEEVGEAREADTTDPPTDIPREEDGDEEVGDPLEATATDPPIDIPREEGDHDEDGDALGPSPQSSPSPPAEPRWYLTDGPIYETFLANSAEDLGSNNVEGMHSHILAGLFCKSQSSFLCSYEDYCPNGKGSSPYVGAPNTEHFNTMDSIESVEWAPMYDEKETSNENSEAGGHWVQVGSIPEDEEGDEDNDFGKCWAWNDWNPSVADIELVVGEDHRRWILCCERLDGGWDGR